MNEVIPRSKRGVEWQEFSERILTHIDNYTVHQYGDKGEDQIADWSIEACQLAIIKYIKRFGRNSRPGQDKLDVLKIAHYACFIYNKIKEENDFTTDDRGRGLYKGEIIGIKAKEAAKEEEDAKC